MKIGGKDKEWKTLCVSCFVVITPGENRWGKLMKRNHLEDPGVDGRIILRWTFRKWNLELWTGSSWLRIGTGGENL